MVVAFWSLVFKSSMLHVVTGFRAELSATTMRNRRIETWGNRLQGQANCIYIINRVPILLSAYKHTFLLAQPADKTNVCGISSTQLEQ